MAAWAHLIEVGHLVGFACREDPFYLLMTLSEMSGDQYMIEVTFYPEYVDLDGHPSDLVVEWGGSTHMREWAEQFLREFHVLPAPQGLQTQLKNRLFHPGVSKDLEINPADPWLTRYPSEES
ncbi:hypothetical protein Q9R20_06425 [Microbacterium sp. PRF11]|uniref:hypothetical protein n=1 Tax=Microbacterium sp. PRF11 TaxID=2962593 RepID=UPI0028812094|nr:hypothetical protein [Microbacterium sp. PRF11]MDT0116623.1 hypothetical protein [Microbacterium sp. PRF11]